MCLYSISFLYCSPAHRDLHSFPTRRSSDLYYVGPRRLFCLQTCSQEDQERRRRNCRACRRLRQRNAWFVPIPSPHVRSEEHTSELQSLRHLVCRLLLEKKNTKNNDTTHIIT